MHGVRVNAAFAYLDPARGRTNLLVLDDTLCDRLVPGGDATVVVGVRAGREVRVHATTVVLAAGAYGSPAILLRSGVGDRVELRRLGIPLVDASPGVGMNLHDHPLVELELSGSVGLRAALREAVAAGFVPEEQTLGKLRSSRSHGPYDLHLVPVAAHEHSLLGGRVLLGVAALEPRSRGRLRLRSADPHEVPLIEHGYLEDAEGHDLAVLVEGVDRCRELAATEPLRSLVGSEIVPGGL